LLEAYFERNAFLKTAQNIYWTSRLGFNLIQMSMDLVRMFYKYTLKHTLFNIQSIFTFGHLKNVHLMQKVF